MDGQLTCHITGLDSAGNGVAPDVELTVYEVDGETDIPALARSDSED